MTESILKEKLEIFMKAFEMVFDSDWEQSKNSLRDDFNKLSIKSDGTFLNPKVADEYNNWISRGVLLNAYRELEKELSKTNKGKSAEIIASLNSEDIAVSILSNVDILSQGIAEGATHHLLKIEHEGCYCVVSIDIEVDHAFEKHLIAEDVALILAGLPVIHV